VSDLFLEIVGEYDQMTCSYRNLERVLKALGMQPKVVKKGRLWKGYIGREYVRIIIHDKAGGRDIPDGTFQSYVKRLGFKSKDDFFQVFTRDIK
jgi:hypothetical protein